MLTLSLTDATPLVKHHLRCVQTESDTRNERHKNSYKVNVKTQLDVMLLWAMQIS